MNGMSGKVLISVITVLTYLIPDIIAFEYNPNAFSIGIHVKSELWPIKSRN